MGPAARARARAARRAFPARRRPRLSAPRRRAPRRPGHRARGGRHAPDAAAVHVRHHRCLQGGPVQPGPAGPHRLRRCREVRPSPRRHRLLLHAAVPRQRDHGAVGARAGRGRDGVPGTDVLRLPLSARRPVLRRDVLHLRRQGDGLPAVHPAARRRRGQHPDARIRHRGLPGGSAGVPPPVRRRTLRGVRLQRGWRGGGRRPGRPAGRARPSCARRRGDRRPRDDGRTPACAARLPRPHTQPRRGDRRDRRPPRRAGFRGLLPQRHRRRGAGAQRLVLVGRSGLRRRRRLPVFRGAPRRLDPGRR